MSGMLFANFNQDYSCVSVGTRKGYSITNCDPFGRVYTQNDGARGIVEMLFCTSLIALVGAPDTPSSSASSPTPNASTSPRKLQIVNTKRQSTICELLFPSSILAVKLNRKTLVIILETEIYVYDMSNMRLLHVLETVPNPEAICALSPAAEAPYLAYPAPLPSPALAAPASPAPTASGSGDVMLFSTRALAPVNVLRAHRSPLALLALSANGSLLATASVKGTVIRVFGVPSADKLYEFRRGAREARIQSLAFNGAGTLLAAASERGTVHLWRVGKPHGDAANKSAGNFFSPFSLVLGTADAFPVANANGNGGTSEDADRNTSRDDSSIADSVDETPFASGSSSSVRRRSLRLPSSLTKAAAAYLPATLAGMWEPARDFAWLRLPPLVASSAGAGERRCVVGLSSTTPHVMVISSDGYFYAYSIDLERGGECVLVKQYSLLESGEDTGM
ncbi:WD40-repeat-containing domain protein [Mycena rosella]|uniref:WD40-repeat-containing domain protein n=1 Tax=Mycena rosella TaxID=1033263 RepID=A0AAD7CTK1_MYCRO|nr:WD40-repeat-containing domain protein [Mycena rosella]